MQLHQLVRLASIITYREGVPLWTAELNDLTVPESAEARE